MRTSCRDLRFPIRTQGHQWTLASRPRVASKLGFSRYPTSSGVAQVAWRTRLIWKAFRWTRWCPRWRRRCHPIWDADVAFERFYIAQVTSRRGMSQLGVRRTTSYRLFGELALLCSRRWQVVENLQLVTITIVPPSSRLCDCSLCSSFTSQC